MAKPTAAVAQIPAAVVKPSGLPRFTKITPVPRKLTPLITCAAILEGSALRILSDSPPMDGVRSANEYLDTIIDRTAVIAMRLCVRIPAAFIRLLRSYPIIAPQRHEMIMRAKSSGYTDKGRFFANSFKKSMKIPPCIMYINKASGRLINYQIASMDLYFLFNNRQMPICEVGKADEVQKRLLESRSTT